MSWMAVAVGGSALLGAFGSKKAGDAQKEASERAAAEQRRQFDTTRADLQPWTSAGKLGLDKLMLGLGLGPKGSMSAPDRAQFARTQTMQGAPGASGGYRPPYNPYNPNNGIQNDYGLGRGGSISSPASQTIFDQTGYDAAMAQYQNQPASDEYGSMLRQFGMKDFEESPSYQWQLQQGKSAIDKAANARGGGNLFSTQTLQDLGKYQQGLASTEFNNAHNRFTTNQNQRYNMLTGMSTAGQNSAAQVGNMGAQVASNIGNLGMQGAQAAGQGYMGMANSLSGGAMGLAGLAQYQQGLNNPMYGPNSNTMPYGKG